MSTSYKVALVIDMDHWQKVEPFLEDIRAGYEVYDQETPDNTYRCIYWDEIVWNIAPEISALLNCLEDIRHSLITINKDDGRIEHDVLTSDEWGTDEEFYEVLTWSADICFWDEHGVLTPICPWHKGYKHYVPVSRERIVGILQSYIENDLAATETGYVYDALQNAGASHDEIRALGLGYCIPED